MFFTKSSGIIMGPITTLFGMIMNGIYEFFYLFGIKNIALTIIVFTIITRLLLLPLTIKQQKFSKVSSRMSPEIQKIQAKYKGKKDEESLRRQQAEMQALYDKYGTKPTGGCLTMFIQIPIMFALFRVINNIPAYVSQVYTLYEKVAIGIRGVSGYEGVIAEIAKKLNVNVSDFSSTTKIIDVLSKFKAEHWDILQDKLPSISDSISANLAQIDQVNNFMSMNITHNPGILFPGILIPILSMALQYIQGKQININNNNATNKDNPAASAMSSMNVVMPIMSGFFCVTMPIGLGLYWIAGSAVAIVQQFFVNKYLEKIDIDQIIEKNVAKASKKNSYIKTADNTTSTKSLQELAKKQTKYIDNTVSNKGVNSNNISNDTDKGTVESPVKSTSNSISEIANILKNRNSEKGDK